MNKKLLYVSIFSLSWALSIILGRYLIKSGLHPLTWTYQSLFFSSLIILSYLLIAKPSIITAGSKRSHRGAILSGIIGGGIANIFGNYGLQLSTAINFGFLIKTAGVFNVILAFLFLKEPISKFKGTLLAIMLFGSYLLSTNGRLLTPHFGDLFILLSAFGYAAASVLNRKVLKKDMHPYAVSLYRAVCGFAVSFVATKLLIGISFQSQFLTLVFFSACLQVVTFIFLNKTLQVASSSYLGMMSMSVPVIVAIIAIPVFKETQSLVQWLGGGLIVIGGILTEVKKAAHHD